MPQKSSNIVFVIIVILILLSNSNTFSQIVTTWSKTFGGIYDDSGNSVQQTSDGGYIITGHTLSYENFLSDVWLIKTNAYGDSLWTKRFGGIYEDSGNSVQQTSDGGYILTGYKTIGGGGPEIDQDVLLVKTNADGNTLWSKTFGGIFEDIGYSVQETIDEGFILTGSTKPSYDDGDRDVWLIKTDYFGDTLWTKTFGGNDYEAGYSVQQTSDGGYIITGTGFNDVWLIKTDAYGDTLWTKTFGWNYYEAGYSVQQTSDGGYIITGNTGPFGHGFADILLIKTKANGDTLWTKTFGGNDYEAGYSVQQTSDGGYIITGYTEFFGYACTNALLIKTDADGDTLWVKTIGGIGNCYSGNSVQQTSDGGYIITGLTWSYETLLDVWLIKTDANGNSLDIHPEKKNNIRYYLSQNYPNPFNPKTSFTYTVPKSEPVIISVYTISGQIIESKTMNLNPGVYQYEFDGSKYSTGVYLYRISTSSGFSSERKMLLLK